MLDFALTTEQLDLQTSARSFALREVLPVAWYYDAQDSLPLEIVRKAFAAGFVGADIPAEYGGRGLGLVESALVTEEMAAACPGLATSIFDTSLGMEPLLLSQNEEAKRAYLPKIARDGKLAAFATSEPTMGSDVAGLRCRATADGDNFILNGTKFWITNGGVADYLSVFATVDASSRHKGICAFFIDMDWPGVSVGLPIPKMGQRTSNTVGIHLQDVRVPKDNVLALPGQGFVLAMKTFARTRPIIGAFGVGAARAALDYAVDYVRKRQAFGAPLASFQAIQFKLAEMLQRVETARLLTWKAAWESDRGMDNTVSAAITKLYSSEAALQVVDEALQIMGGYGYTKMFPIEKLLRDVRLLRIYEGTSEVQHIVLADHLLKKYRPTLPPLEDLALHGRDPLDPQAPPNTGKTWRCRICGHVHYGDNPPESCPLCFFAGTAFKEIVATAP